MPTPDALQMLFKGDQLRPAAAKKMGLVHDVAPVERDRRARQGMGEGQPERQGAVGRPEIQGAVGQGLLAQGMMIWPPANAIYRRETYDNYPAAKAILSSVFEGLQLPMDLALAVESRYFAKILRSKEAAAMIRSLFISMGELNKGARRPQDVPRDQLAQDRRARRRLHGRRRRLCLGERRARGRADRPRPGIGRQGQGAFGEADLAARSPRAAPRAPTATRCSRASMPTPTTPSSKGCDLVVEAVFEDRAVKEEATKKAQAVLGAGRDLRQQHLDAADRLARRDLAEAGEFHRHPFLLAGRQDDAGRDHHGREDRARRRWRPRSTSCARSRRRRSSSTTAAASSPTAASAITSARAISC